MRAASCSRALSQRPRRRPSRGLCRRYAGIDVPIPPGCPPPRLRVVPTVGSAPATPRRRAHRHHRIRCPAAGAAPLRPGAGPRRRAARPRSWPPGPSPSSSPSRSSAGGPTVDRASRRCSWACSSWPWPASCRCSSRASRRSSRCASSPARRPACTSPRRAACSSRPPTRTSEAKPSASTAPSRWVASPSVQPSAPSAASSSAATPFPSCSRPSRPWPRRWCWPATCRPSARRGGARVRAPSRDPAGAHRRALRRPRDDGHPDRAHRTRRRRHPLSAIFNRTVLATLVLTFGLHLSFGVYEVVWSLYLIALGATVAWVGLTLRRVRHPGDDRGAPRRSLGRPQGPHPVHRHLLRRHHARRHRLRARARLRGRHPHRALRVARHRGHGTGPLHDAGARARRAAVPPPPRGSTAR